MNSTNKNHFGRTFQVSAFVSYASGSPHSNFTRPLLDNDNPASPSSELQPNDGIKNFLKQLTDRTTTPPAVEVEEVDDLYKKSSLFSADFTTADLLKPKLTGFHRPACAKSDMQTFCNDIDVTDYPE